MTRRLAVLALALLGAACGKNKETIPVQPAGDPTPAAERVVRPTAASGVYRLAPLIESGNRPQSTSGRTPPANMTLSSESAAVPAAGASSAQYNAIISLPGYTRAPRGRNGQSAAWWPAAGDSVVVQFSQGTRGEIQLRGALRGTTIRGEIWYVSGDSGSTFQLGTFTATKVR